MNPSLRNCGMPVTDGELHKSNIPSAEFFSLHKIARCWDLNLRIVEASAGTLVGLGLLGTFLGLTLGINNFDTSNANNIQSSIHNLLDGMGTAFATSLVGMGLSIIYTIIVDDEYEYVRGFELKTDNLDFVNEQHVAVF